MYWTHTLTYKETSTLPVWSSSHALDINHDTGHHMEDHQLWKSSRETSSNTDLYIPNSCIGSDYCHPSVCFLKSERKYFCLADKGTSSVVKPSIIFEGPVCSLLPCILEAFTGLMAKRKVTFNFTLRTLKCQWWVLWKSGSGVGMWKWRFHMSRHIIMCSRYHLLHFTQYLWNIKRNPGGYVC